MVENLTIFILVKIESILCGCRHKPDLVINLIPYDVSLQQREKAVVPKQFEVNLKVEKR